MNKKEISEIKKQLTPANCAITRVCGCYVDGEKQKIAEFHETFLALPEEEQFKYFEIFRKVLSGTVGKNLLNMDFPLDTEMAGGTQHSLLALRDSELKNDEMLSAFYDRIIESYDFGENYLILIYYAAYDVPGKSRDNLEMDDASDEVYRFIESCICPVSLAKPALSYDAAENTFRNRIRDWIVDMPDLGFLFPAFNDRTTDLHSLLYYTRKAEELHFDFTDKILGTVLPLTASNQKEVFTMLIEETLQEECDFDTARNIHDTLRELADEYKDSPDPVVLDEMDVKNVLATAGAKSEKLESFGARFESTAGAKTEFAATNIMNARKFEVRTPDVVIQVSPDRADLVEKKYIDGRPCLVIPITDEITVNGIRVANELPPKKTEE